MISLILNDSTKESNFKGMEVPIVEDTIENATDVRTLDYNVYTDFISQKREWKCKWSYMSESEYNDLVGFYNRQFTSFEYPLLTIEHYNLYDIPVRLKIESKNIADNCGTIQDVVITLRETVQLPDIGVS